MKKRLAAVLVVFCLLFCALPVQVWAEQDGPLLRSAGEIVEYLDQCVGRQDGQIIFYYTENLDEVFAVPESMHDMARNAGMINWTQYRDTNRRRVRLDEIEYYPGVRIASALRLGDLSMLTADEMSALAVAQKMALEARKHAQSPYEVLRQLHDRLALTVTYTESPSGDGWAYGDTALGALLNGQADCDGYADAFRLLCSLCEFEVGFQRGVSDNGEDEPSSHLWNLIRLDGVWYHVDVTWDDMDVPDIPDICGYRYFIIGSEMISDSHTWDERISIAPMASWNNWDWFFYTCDNTGITYGSYFNTLEDAANHAVYLRKEHSADRFHIMVDGNYEDGVAINDALVDAGLKGRWTTWTENMGEYTCFDIAIRD